MKTVLMVLCILILLPVACLIWAPIGCGCALLGAATQVDPNTVAVPPTPHVIYDDTEG